MIHRDNNLRSIFRNWPVIERKTVVSGSHPYCFKHSISVFQNIACHPTIFVNCIDELVEIAC